MFTSSFSLCQHGVGVQNGGATTWKEPGSLSQHRALAAPAAAAAGPGPRAPRRGRPAPRLWSVPARALSCARALPRARHPGARRVRLLRALPGCRGRELRGPGRRALRPRAGVREPRRRGGARGHRALRVRAARRGVRVRRPLLPQRLRTAPARSARSWKAPGPPAQGARWPLRICSRGHHSTPKCSQHHRGPGVPVL